MSNQLPFESFCNAFAGQECFVIGRGPTEFDYADLEAEECPVFFINDAISLENHARGPSFFFAHDRRMSRWLQKGIRSTAILPEDGPGKILQGPLDPVLSSIYNPIVLYKWRKMEGERLLNEPRESIRDLRQLYENSGTIHSLIHFIWYAGFKKINFIGCDGISKRWQPYDSRITNLSNSSPFWQYRKIFSVQQRLCTKLGIERHYIGTPSLPYCPESERIPRIIHLIWFGQAIPTFVSKNIERMEMLHPDWEIKLWRDFPTEFPSDARELAKLAPFLCQQADVLRVWLLLNYGGIYLDTDIYALRPLDDLTRSDHFFVYEQARSERVANSVFGSRAEHPLLEELWNQLCKRLPCFLERTTLGPKLFSEFCRNNDVNLLPAHYFFIFTTRGTVLNFMKSTILEQNEFLVHHRSRITDDVMPYGVHAWGIPASQMPAGVGVSSTAKHPSSLPSPA